MENTSGIYPVTDKVLIRPVEVEEMSTGGILLPTTTKDKEDMAQMHGVLIAAGDEALESPQLRNIVFGDMIIHARHAGLSYIGKDAVRYRVMRVSDLVAKTDGVWDKRFRASIPMPGV